MGGGGGGLHPLVVEQGGGGGGLHPLVVEQGGGGGGSPLEQAWPGRWGALGSGAGGDGQVGR